MCFRKFPERLFFFVRKVPSEKLLQLYRNKDLPSECLLMIFNSINLQALRYDPIKWSNRHSQETEKTAALSVLQTIARTQKFDLCIMLFSKKEKQGESPLITLP